MTLNLIMLGPPGAGKGTQAERFARAHGILRISTGDILREAVAASTELGRLAKETMEAGRLVSDDVMIEIVRERLARPDAAKGFVLDGFPRTVAQARALDRIMAAGASGASGAGRGPLVVVDIVVPQDELVRRTAQRRVCGRCGATAAADGATGCERCGGALVVRSDDGAGTVLRRLQVYERDTKPLVEYYRARPTFRVIDGDQPPAAVAAEVEAAVDEALRSQRV